MSCISQLKKHILMYEAHQKRSGKIFKILENESQKEKDFFRAKRGKKSILKYIHGWNTLQKWRGNAHCQVYEN